MANKVLMELVSFIFMLVLTNIFFLEREIGLIVSLLKEKDVSDMDPLPVSPQVTYAIIIVNCVHNVMRWSEWFDPRPCDDGDNRAPSLQLHV